MDSEETQDFVRETLAMSQEEAEERLALGQVLQVSLEESITCATTVAVVKPLRFLQNASMVIEEGCEARTINLCHRCFNEKLVQQGKQSLKSKEWREVVEREAHRGRLWNIFGSDQFLRGMWEYFTHRRAWARKILADAAQEKTRSNTRSVVTRVTFQKSFGASQKKCGYRLQCPKDAPCVQCKDVGQLGTQGKLCVWTIERLQEAHDKVALEKCWTPEHCAGHCEKEHGLLETAHRSSRRNGKSYVIVRLPALQLLPLADYIWWVATVERRSISTGGAQHAEVNTNGERPTGF